MPKRTQTTVRAMAIVYEIMYENSISSFLLLRAKIGKKNLNGVMGTGIIFFGGRREEIGNSE
jgi:hypothetical protein